MPEKKIKCSECGKTIDLLFNVNRQEIIVNKGKTETSRVRINEFYFDDNMELVCPHCNEINFIAKDIFKGNGFEKRNKGLNS